MNLKKIPQLALKVLKFSLHFYFLTILWLANLLKQKPFFHKIFTYLALDNILGHENWLELAKMPIKITWEKETLGPILLKSFL